MNPTLHAIQLIPRSFIHCWAKRKSILDFGSRSNLVAYKWHISVGELTFDIGESTSYVGETTGICHVAWRHIGVNKMEATTSYKLPLSLDILGGRLWEDRLYHMLSAYQSDHDLNKIYAISQVLNITPGEIITYYLTGWIDRNHLHSLSLACSRYFIKNLQIWITWGSLSVIISNCSLKNA